VSERKKIITSMNKPKSANLISLRLIAAAKPNPDYSSSSETEKGEICRRNREAK